MFRSLNSYMAHLLGSLSNDDGDVRLGRRLVKNEFLFYRRISQMPRSVQCVYRSQNLLKYVMPAFNSKRKYEKNKPPSLTFSKIPRTWSFRVVVLERRRRNVPRIITHVHSYCSGPGCSKGG